MDVMDHAGHQHLPDDHAQLAANHTDQAVHQHAPDHTDQASDQHAADHTGKADDPHRVHTHGEHAGHSTVMFKNRFWLSLALTIPVVIFSPMAAHLLGYHLPVFPGSVWVESHCVGRRPGAA